MKIGCCLPFSQYENAKEVGFDFIELKGIEICNMHSETFERTVDIINNSSLPCEAINGFCNAQVPLLGKDYCEKSVIEYCNRIAFRANKLGAKRIGVGAPFARNIEQDFPKDVAINQFINSMTILANATQKYGIKSMIEPMNKNLCNFINTTQEAYEICKEINHKNMSIMIDFYHAEMESEPFDTLNSLVEKSDHVHIAQIDGENRGYLTLENKEKYSQWAKILKDNDYNKLVSIELNVPFDKEAYTNSLKLAKSIFN